MDRGDVACIMNEVCNATLKHVCGYQCEGCPFDYEDERKVTNFKRLYSIAPRETANLMYRS